MDIGFVCEFSVEEVVAFESVDDMIRTYYIVVTINTYNENKGKNRVQEQKQIPKKKKKKKCNLPIH